jgi:hypothetical protein
VQRKRPDLAARNRARVRHGETVGGRESPEYAAWHAMLQRGIGSKDGERYAARGITVCERWLKFENFLADIGRKPSPAHSLERLDNSLSYEPGNVVWATAKVQARNRRNNRLVTFRGETMPVAAWAERLGMERHALLYRLDNWPIERALTEPLNR